MVARAHRDAPYAEAQAAGRALAAQSRMPQLVAVNLGAGFGQWDWFPEAEDVVAFALAYVAPSNAEELWAIAKAWASDDAAGRQTILALVGKDLLQHELKRIEVPELKELLGARPAQAAALRASLGLAVAASAAARATKPATTRAAAAAKAASPPASGPVSAPASGPASAPARAPVPPGEVYKMPKPAFVPPKVAAPVVVRRFSHPKFGEGTLVSQEGEGEEAKLTIAFAAGKKTLLARYVSELPPA